MNFQDKITAIFNNGDCWDFIEGDYQEQNCLLVENLSDIQYDSYGYENSYLCYVFECLEHNRFFKISGNRSSYNGTDWAGVAEVKQKEKTVKYWE